MFDRWRKQDHRREQGFKNPDVDQRVAAISGADPSDEDVRAQLMDVLRDDTDPIARSAALKKLVSTPDQLLVLIQGLEPRTLAILSSEIAPQADLDGLIELIVRVPKALQSDLLANVQLRSEEGLMRLERQSRNRDKATNRHARTQLEQLRNLRRTLDELTTQLAGIDQNLIQTRDQDARPEQRVSKLRTLLSKRQDIVLELHQCIAQAEDEFAEAIVIAPPANCPINDDDLVIPEDPFRDLMPRLDALAQLTGDPMAAVAAWAEFQADWQAKPERPGVELEERYAAIAARFQRLQAALDKLGTFPQQASAKKFQSLVKQLNWPETFTAPQKLIDIQAQLGQAEAEAQASHVAQTEAVKAFAHAVEALEQHLDNGQYKTAVGAIKQARAALSKLPSGEQKTADARLVGLSLRLNELRDWQQYATNPKRTELLSALEKIAQNPAEPPQQAAQLRHLRQQWQQLGRPSSAEDFAHQQRFDELAEIAYAPCAAYNTQQRAVRAENLAGRKEICEQLERYLQQTDLQQPDLASDDLKTAEKIMRTARAEWQRLAPCDRKALKPVEQKFEALQEQLHSALQNRWDNNLQARQQIIDAAREALDADDPMQGINTAKQLQQQWKNAGPAPRRAEQQLWQTFRSICDQIFAQRDVARTEQNAARQALIDRLDAAINALDLVLQVNDPDQPLDMGKIREQESAITSARADVKPSRDQLARINAIQDQISARKRSEKQRNVLDEITQWLTWDTQISEAESMQQTLEPPHAVFKPRCAGQGTAGDLLALVLEAEIAADIASPVEDQTSRMALQIELMNQGKRNLGQAGHKELLTRWCSIGPKPANAETQGRRARLEHALQRLASGVAS